jgi:hypothetical protein
MRRGLQPHLDFVPPFLVEPRRARECRRLEQHAVAQLFDDHPIEIPPRLTLAQLAAVVVIVYCPLIVVPDLQHRQLSKIARPQDEDVLLAAPEVPAHSPCA